MDEGEKKKIVIEKFIQIIILFHGKITESHFCLHFLAILLTQIELSSFFSPLALYNISSSLLFLHPLFSFPFIHKDYFWRKNCIWSVFCVSHEVIAMENGEMMISLSFTTLVFSDLNWTLFDVKTVKDLFHFGLFEVLLAMNNISWVHDPFS